MSVTVKHLNADSTFLLTFSPEPRPAAFDLRSSQGAYTILIDPWLTGPSIVSAPWFAKTVHNIPPCIRDLSEIEEPDVVLVSQNKPDHCHGATLRQLNPEGKTVIAAEHGAAKTIRSWKHFDPRRVIGLEKYNPREKFSSLRLDIPPLSPLGDRGEVVISFIPAKNYVTGLHNAFGITYRPPTHFKAFASVSTIQLPKRTTYFHMPFNVTGRPSMSSQLPFSPAPALPATATNMVQESQHFERPRTAGDHRPRLRSSTTGSSEFLPFQQVPAMRSPPSLTLSLQSDDELVSPPFSPSNLASTADTSPSFGLDSPPFAQALPTPPESPISSPSGSFLFHHASMSSTMSQQSSLLSNNSVVTPGRPRPISVIYTPHGINFSPDLIPYTQHHLVKLGALPLTLLLHSFDRAQNPWYFGGNIMTGSVGGVEIARGLMARCWLSAHDEAKDDRGVSVRQLRLTRVTPEQVRRALWAGPEGEWLRKKGWCCDVRSLGVGAEMLIGPARDLLSGMETNRDSRLLRFG